MADIQLSGELFQDIQAAVAKQHPGADAAVVTQYLAAVMGYMAGSQRGVAAEARAEFMEELCAFSRHVFDDLNAQQSNQSAQAPAGQAFGYWEPPKD